MRLAFFDFTDWNYTVAAAYERPLGGSQSALCYLAEALASAGHEVWLFNNTRHAIVARGVRCAPVGLARSSLLHGFDCAIVLNTARQGARLRERLGQSVPLVLWMQHAHDQPASMVLSDRQLRRAYDAFAFVSRWQRDQFVAAYDLPASRAMILRNAVGPRFAHVGSPQFPLPAEKWWPPKLIYTSTPFRGLDLLLDAFPAIRRAVPEVTLQVFSSLQVYQATAEQDQQAHGALYERCHQTPGVKYHGSVPQPHLAEHLRQATMLAYPNHFPETSCIAVLEALAAGCLVVTSELGALPETTQGFARLIPVDGDWSGYLRRFVEATVAELLQVRQQRAEVARRQSQQIATLQQTANWTLRAEQWNTWLGVVCAQADLAPAP